LLPGPRIGSPLRPPPPFLPQGNCLKGFLPLRPGHCSNSVHPTVVVSSLTSGNFLSLLTRFFFPSYLPHISQVAPFSLKITFSDFFTFRTSPISVLWNPRSLTLSFPFLIPLLFFCSFPLILFPSSLFRSGVYCF